MDNEEVGPLVEDDGWRRSVRGRINLFGSGFVTTVRGAAEGEEQRSVKKSFGLNRA
jgi:hypothetical protein